MCSDARNMQGTGAAQEKVQVLVTTQETKLHIQTVAKP